MSAKATKATKVMKVTKATKATAVAPDGASVEPVSPSFARRVIEWQRRHGRHDLPWQNTRDAYRIWLSEIMLQQTQVGTALPYYLRFLDRFPNVAGLAAADLDEVLQLWSGLGYYSRARNLHKAAQQVVAAFNGRFPADRLQLESLPGVGRSTAAAIAAFAYGLSEAILDGNVKRVLARHYAVPGFPGDGKVAARLWQIAEAALPGDGIEAYTQGLMDLGATLCTRTPECGRCPVAQTCKALQQNAVSDYPAARAKREVPRREATMPILLHAGRVWLQPRPPTGIWGGLWAFPELPPGVDAPAWCRSTLGLRIDVAQALPVLRHGFTHFSLAIQPVLCSVVDSSAEGVRSVEGRWLPLAEALKAAVPKPVRSLIEQVMSLESEFVLDNNNSIGSMKKRNRSQK